MKYNYLKKKIENENFYSEIGMNLRNYFFQEIYEKIIIMM